MAIATGTVVAFPTPVAFALRIDIARLQAAHDRSVRLAERAEDFADVADRAGCPISAKTADRLSDSHYHDAADAWLEMANLEYDHALEAGQASLDDWLQAA